MVVLGIVYSSSPNLNLAWHDAVWCGEGGGGGGGGGGGISYWHFFPPLSLLVTLPPT